MRRKRLLAAIAGMLLVVGAGAGIVVAASDSGSGGDRLARATGFHPSKVTGKWTGQWNNTTFGSKGSIRANVQFRKGQKFVPLLDFGGTVFGCSDPKQEVVTLPRGSGKNTWNSSGFRVSKFFKAFGKLNITYKNSDKSFKGSGSRPPCNAQITYTINGKLTGSNFSATVKITKPFKATSKLTAKKN